MKKTILIVGVFVALGCYAVLLLCTREKYAPPSGVASESLVDTGSANKTALEELRKNGEASFTSTELEMLVNKWPGELIVLAKTFEDRSKRAVVEGAVVKRLARMNVASAIGLLKKHSLQMPDEAYERVFGTFALQDPIAALDAVKELPGHCREEVLDAIARDAGQIHAKGIFRWLEEQERPHHELLAMEAAKGLANQSAEEALAYVDQAFRRVRPSSEGALEAIAVKAIMRTLLENDSEMVVGWIVEEPTRIEVLKTSEFEVLGIFARLAPEFIIEQAKQSEYMREPARTSGGGGLRLAFMALAQKDVEAATEEAAEWSDRPEYENILDAIDHGIILAHGDMSAVESPRTQKAPEATTWIWLIADASPKEAAKHLQGEDLLPANVDGTYTNVAYRWAKKAPAEAAEWVDNLPEGSTKQAAQSMVVSEWAKKDPGAASEWVARLPEGPGREKSVIMLVTRLRDTNPAGALASVEMLPEDRQFLFAKIVLESWISSSPDAAKGALDEISFLSDQDKQRLMSE